MLSFPKSYFYSAVLLTSPVASRTAVELKKKKKNQHHLLLMKHKLCDNICHRRRARAIFILVYSSQISVVLSDRGPAVQEELGCSQ